MFIKWKQWALHVNLKKTSITFLIISILYAVTACVLVYTNFTGRFAGSSGWHGEENLMLRAWLSSFMLQDWLLLGMLVLIGTLLAVTYWILCILWIMQKSERAGTLTAFWVLAALPFHVFAVAALYLYAAYKGCCPVCGRIPKKGDYFCRACGAPLLLECPDCQRTIPYDSTFCPNCGKKL